MTGFTARPALSELVQLGRERGIPGLWGSRQRAASSICARTRVDEPLVPGFQISPAGANLVSFSGDKLLPADRRPGIIAGDADLVKNA